jgi:ferric-dicitrate binding protein FerR (iron transport regulator)
MNMNRRTDHITMLLIRHLRDELTAGDRSALEAWKNASERNAALYDELTGADGMAAILHRRGRYNKQRIAAKLNAEFAGLSLSDDPDTTQPTAAPVHRVHILKTAWFKYAAAIILLIAAATTYFFIHTSQPETAVVQNVRPASDEDDVPPGYNRAILTLSDGRKIELDSAVSETINDGTLSIKNNNGQLIYGNPPIPSNGGVDAPAENINRSQSGGAAGVGLNTMTTPRGGQYQLTLSDGTKVWLNAASSITYPTAFTGKTREVKITGEAYFEVKPNKEKPFIVKTVSDVISVLGTEFNVNAYADEDAVKTSLIQGAIKVGDTFIKPGQAYQNGKVKQTNTQQDVAWKNGSFDFNNLNGAEAMRQLARWYDVQFVFDRSIIEVKFWGELDRSLTLNQVLKGLEGIGGLHFVLNGKTVTVTR